MYQMKTTNILVIIMIEIAVLTRGSNSTHSLLSGIVVVVSVCLFIIGWLVLLLRVSTLACRNTREITPAVQRIGGVQRRFLNP